MNYNDCVKIHKELNRNTYGEQAWDSGTTTKARVIEKSVETLDLRDERTMSDLLIHLPISFTKATIGSLVTYSDTTYIVLEVSKPKNEVGHTRDIKLICKKYGNS